MRTQYQYIHFVKVAEKASVVRKTSEWSCRSNRNGAELGTVQWYAPWRQYCYEPTAQAVYSDSCLIGIAAFLGGLNDERKSSLVMDRLAEER